MNLISRNGRFEYKFFWEIFFVVSVNIIVFIGESEI